MSGKSVAMQSPTHAQIDVECIRIRLADNSECRLSMADLKSLAADDAMLPQWLDALRQIARSAIAAGMVQQAPAYICVSPGLQPLEIEIR